MNLRSSRSLLLACLFAAACSEASDPLDGEQATPPPAPAATEPAAPEQQWAPSTEPAAEIDVDEDVVFGEPIPEEPRVTFQATERPAPPWNSVAGRAEASVAMGSEPALLALPQLRTTKEACVTPEFMTGSQSGQYPDNGPKVKSPASAFASEADGPRRSAGSSPRRTQSTTSAGLFAVWAILVAWK